MVTKTKSDKIRATIPRRECVALGSIALAYWTVCGSMSVQVQIRGESVESTLSTHAGFFVTTKRTRGIKLVVRVRPDHAGFDLASDLENLAALVGPHAAAESVRRVVGFLDRFFNRAKRLDR